MEWLRNVYVVVVAFSILSCSPHKSQPEPAGADASSKDDWLQKIEVTGFQACEAVIRLLAKNPSTARIPRVRSIPSNGNLFVFDWTRLDGLAFQNGMGALIDATASCAATGETVVSLSLNNELIDARKVRDLAREANLPSSSDPAIFKDISELSTAWQGSILSLLSKARLNSFLLEGIYFNAHRKLWAKRRFHVGPVQLLLGREADTFECDRERATARFLIASTQSAFFEEKELAKNNQDPVFDLLNNYSINLNYCQFGDSWRFVGGSYSGGVLGDSVLEVDINEADSIPVAGLLPFVITLGTDLTKTERNSD